MSERRRIAVAVVAGVGLGAFGAVPAHAKPAATGNERACERHAENKGRSLAHGLDCESAAPTLTVSFESHTSSHECWVRIIGSGLLAGSEIIFESDEGGGYTLVAATVSGDGTVNIRYFTEFQFVNVVVSGTTASGEPISTGSVRVAC